MKQAMPVVLNNELYVAIGNDRHEYIVGKTILNPESLNEKQLWERAAKASLIDELIKVCEFLIENKTNAAKEMASDIINYLLEAKREYPKCITLFKENIKETYNSREDLYYE